MASMIGLFRSFPFWVAVGVAASGCSSSSSGGFLADGGIDGAAGTGGAGGGAGSGGAVDHVTVTGGDQGEAPSASTISGSDYANDHGVQCKIASLATQNLRIDARDGNDGLAPTVVLQYWNFDLYTNERDEDFSPPPPAVETFNTSITSYDGTNLFMYWSASDWSAHLAEGPACHTSFTQLSTARVAGTLTCSGLYNEHSGGVASFSIDFGCAITPY